MWYLFLDDLRELSFLKDKQAEKNLSYVEGPWIIARSMEQALDLIDKKGCPSVISFDHDLGEKDGKPVPSGFDLAKWLVDQDLDGNLSLDQMSFQVHSDNPVGKKNIEGLLTQYLEFKKNN